MINLDLPDIKDYLAEHLFGEVAGGDIPKAVNLYNLNHTHNQGNSMKCTGYCLTHCFEILNTIDLNTEVEFNPEEQWKNQKVYPATGSDKEGDYLQSALKSLKKFGLTYNGKKYTIDGYAKVSKSEESIKKQLANGYPVYTGAIINRDMDITAKSTAIYDYNLFSEKNKFGHCFLIVGYDDEANCWIILNSYGKEYGTNGIVYLDYKYTNKLFTPYIVYDTDDEAIKKSIFKDITENSPMYEEVKWAKDNGIVKGYKDSNGDDVFLPNKPITRAEACVMLKRLHDLINK